MGKMIDDGIRTISVVVITKEEADRAVERYTAMGYSLVYSRDDEPGYKGGYRHYIREFRKCIFDEEQSQPPLEGQMKLI